MSQVNHQSFSVDQANGFQKLRPLNRVKLICCIGASQNELFSPVFLRHFLQHYLGLGIYPRNFLLTLHAVDEARDVDEIHSLLDHFSIKRPAYTYGEYDCYKFHEQNLALLASCSIYDWVIMVDFDELIELPRSLPEFIAELESTGCNLAVGSLIDRVARDGELREFQDSSPVWDQYPEKLRITRDILRGFEQKICLFRNIMRPNLGHHVIAESTAALKPFQNLLNVHHFKWDITAPERLALTLERFRKDPEKYWWVDEVERALGRIKNGRLCLDGCERIP